MSRWRDIEQFSWRNVPKRQEEDITLYQKRPRDVLDVAVAQCMRKRYCRDIFCRFGVVLQRRKKIAIMKEKEKIYP